MKKQMKKKIIIFKPPKTGIYKNILRFTAAVTGWYQYGSECFYLKKGQTKEIKFIEERKIKKF